MAQRLVTAISRNAAIHYCNHIHTSPSIIISISTPLRYYTSAPFISPMNNVQAICRLTFADADQPGPDVYDTPVTEKDLISDDDAKRIRDFVLSKPDCTVIVHCDAGYSRSAGVAAAIMKALNGDDSLIFDSAAYRPNMRCYRKVLEAFIENQTAQ